MKSWTTAALALSILAASGCGRRFDTLGMDREGVESVADQAFREGDWREAELLYTELLFSFPGAADTDFYLFRLAQAEAGQGMWVDADFQFRRVVSEFPRSAWADDAQLELARVGWRQHRDYRRDLTPVLGALEEVRTFLSRYPGSDLTPEALALEDSCLTHLARRSLFIGQFYARRSLYDSALLYYREAMDDYGGRGCRGEILVSLGELYERMGNSYAARTSYSRALEEDLSGSLLEKASEGLERLGGT